MKDKANFRVDSLLTKFCNSVKNISLFKVIAAEGEQKASRALKEASLIISESPSALQLRSVFGRAPHLHKYPIYVSDKAIYPFSNKTQKGHRCLD